MRNLQFIFVLLMVFAPVFSVHSGTVPSLPPPSSEGSGGFDGSPQSPDQQRRNILLVPCDPQIASCVSYQTPPINFANGTELNAGYRLRSDLKISALRLYLTDIGGLELFGLVDEKYSTPEFLSAGMHYLPFVAVSCFSCILILELDLSEGGSRSFGAAVSFGNEGGTLIGNGSGGETLGSSFPGGSSGGSPAQAQGAGGCAVLREAPLGPSLNIWILLATSIALFLLRRRMSLV